MANCIQSITNKIYNCYQYVATSWIGRRIDVAVSYVAESRIVGVAKRILSPLASFVSNHPYFTAACIAGVTTGTFALNFFTIKEKCARCYQRIMQAYNKGKGPQNPPPSGRSGSGASP